MHTIHLVTESIILKLIKSENMWGLLLELLTTEHCMPHSMLIALFSFSSLLMNSLISGNYRCYNNKLFPSGWIKAKIKKKIKMLYIKKTTRGNFISLFSCNYIGVGEELLSYSWVFAELCGD